MPCSAGGTGNNLHAIKAAWIGSFTSQGAEVSVTGRATDTVRGYHQGRTTGAHPPNKGWMHRPHLVSIKEGNAGWQAAKTGALPVLTGSHGEQEHCSLLCFMETWLNAETPDSAVTLDGSHITREGQKNRRKQQEERKRTCCFCEWQTENITVEPQLLLTEGLWPYYIQREISHAIVSALNDSTPSLGRRCRHSGDYTFYGKWAPRLVPI